MTISGVLEQVELDLSVDEIVRGEVDGPREGEVVRGVKGWEQVPQGGQRRRGQR